MVLHLAVQCWALLPIRNELPAKVSPGLIEEIVNKIFLRAHPALGSALAAVADIVENVPILFRVDLIEKLLDALKLLAVETEVIRSRTDAVGEQIGIDLEERPTIRRYAAFLASRLFGLALRSGQALSPVLKTWETIGQKDVLPEVRHAWNREV